MSPFHSNNKHYDMPSCAKEKKRIEKKMLLCTRSLRTSHDEAGDEQTHRYDNMGCA